MNLKKVKANLTELKLNDKIILVSYETPVAYQDRATGVFYRTSKFWSSTTSRHINGFVGQGKFETVSQESLDNLLNGVK